MREKAVGGTLMLTIGCTQFFYAKAPSVQRVERSDAQAAAADAELESNLAPQDAENDGGDEAGGAQPQSLLESLPTGEVSSSGDNNSSAVDWNVTRDRVAQAIAEMASDAGEFYAKVQSWRRIPRAFEVLAWDERSGAVDDARRKAVQGWLIAELSRTVFKDDPLDMDLVEYMLGLVEHPEFCQPDLLVLELHEFLGSDVRVRVSAARCRFVMCGVLTTRAGVSGWCGWRTAVRARALEVPGRGARDARGVCTSAIAWSFVRCGGVCALKLVVHVVSRRRRRRAWPSTSDREMRKRPPSAHAGSCSSCGSSSKPVR